MLIITLIIAVIALTAYGLLWRIAAMALLQYMCSRYMLIPTRTDLRESVKAVLRQILRKYLRSRR